MELLLVVDMQTDFVAAQDPGLVRAIEDEAAAVMARGGRVVLINMDGCGGGTVGIPEAAVLWKDEDDGGNLVYSWLVGAGLVGQDLRVRVAGVNLCACVYRTACGLAHRLYNEHSICDAVKIATPLCGEGSKFRIRFEL